MGVFERVAMASAIVLLSVTFPLRGIAADLQGNPPQSDQETQQYSNWAKNHPKQAEYFSQHPEAAQHAMDRWRHERQEDHRYQQWAKEHPQEARFSHQHPELAERARREHQERQEARHEDRQWGKEHSNWEAHHPGAERFANHHPERAAHDINRAQQRQHTSASNHASPARHR